MCIPLISKTIKTKIKLLFTLKKLKLIYKDLRNRTLSKKKHNFFTRKPLGKSAEFLFLSFSVFQCVDPVIPTTVKRRCYFYILLENIFRLELTLLSSNDTARTRKLWNRKTTFQKSSKVFDFVTKHYVYCLNLTTGLSHVHWTLKVIT